MSKLPSGFKTVDRTAVRGRLQKSNESPLNQSLRSLLVKDRTIRNERDADNKTKPPIGKVKSISDIISNNIQASTDLRTITHYIKRAEQIWTTLLLKPNGDQRQLLIYDSESSDIKNGKLHDILIQVVENYFTTKYPFEELAPQIIKDVLFRTGSYVLVNVSHAVLDHLINGQEVEGTESFRSAAQDVLTTQFHNNDWGVAKNLGYIRKNKPANAVSTTGFESLYGPAAPRENEYFLVDESLRWTFTDNPVVLKAGHLAQRLRESRLKSLNGLESLDTAVRSVFTKERGKRHKANNNHINAMSKKTFEEEIKGLYPDRNYNKNVETINVRKGKFYSGNGRGIGITYQWPSEACVNVCLNGEVGKPFGHILMIDPETGEPLKNTSDVKFYQKTKGAGAVDNTPKMGSLNEIISHIRQVAQGKECTEDMAWMAEMASATLEKQFIEGFLNGDLHKDVSVSLTEENKKLFLSRALRDQGVRCVFVPSEYVTYIAIDFNRLGSGRSLVDEAKLHIGRLAVLDTADTLASIENAISHTLMTIDLEKEDLDPRNMVAMIRDEYYANNPTLHDILGYNNVSIDAVLDRFKEQSLTIKVNANDNPGIIAPQIEASQMEREPLKNIDQESRDNLLNAISGFFGLKRSWLEDTGDGNEFAVEALADQELLRNQTNDYSRTFSRYFTDFMRKHIRVSEPLINELVEVIKENKKLYQKPDQGPFPDLTDEMMDELNSQDGADQDLTDLDVDMIEAVLKDFLNNFYVVLPTPAITDSLNKISEKIEAVKKLVDEWLEMGGGATTLRSRAEKAGIDAEEVMDTLRAALLADAFERFNLPMPFETIINNGDAGGILNLVNRSTDMQMNVIRYIEEFIKAGKRIERKAETLKDKAEKAGLGTDLGYDGDNDQATDWGDNNAEVDISTEIAPAPSDDMFKDDLNKDDSQLNETEQEENLEDEFNLKGSSDDLWTPPE